MHGLVLILGFYRNVGCIFYFRPVVEDTVKVKDTKNEEKKAKKTKKKVSK